MDFIQTAFDMLDLYKQSGHSNYSDVANLEPPYTLEIKNDIMYLIKTLDFSTDDYKDKVLIKQDMHGEFYIGKILDVYINDMENDR